MKRYNTANRGMTLEHLVENTNVRYLHTGIAQVHKFPTPVKVEKAYQDGKITGHWEKKSTVDFIGTIKDGISICFDCKEISIDTRFPLDKVHGHQYEYMKNVDALGGIAFLIVNFTGLNKYFRLSFYELSFYWERYTDKEGMTKRKNGTASIPLSAFTTEIFRGYDIALDYLKGIVD